VNRRKENQPETRTVLLILLHLFTYTITIVAIASTASNDQVFSRGSGRDRERGRRKSEIESSRVLPMAPLFRSTHFMPEKNKQTLHALFISMSRWLRVLLTLLFMMSVTTILLKILIAQLSLTYELVQEESLNSFTALRMQAVAIIE